MQLTLIVDINVWLNWGFDSFEQGLRCSLLPVPVKINFECHYFSQEVVTLGGSSEHRDKWCVLDGENVLIDSIKGSWKSKLCQVLRITWLNLYSDYYQSSKNMRMIYGCLEIHLKLI